MKTLSLLTFFNLLTLCFSFAQSPTLPLDAICSSNGGRFGIIGTPSNANDGGMAFIYEKKSPKEWTLVQSLGFSDLGFASFFVALDSAGMSDYTVRYRNFGSTVNITDDFAVVAFNRRAVKFEFPFEQDTTETQSAIFKRNGNTWEFQEIVPGGNQIEIRRNQVFVTQNLILANTELDVFLRFQNVINTLSTFQLGPNAGSTIQLIDFSDYNNFSEFLLTIPLTPELSVSQDGNLIAWSLLGELEDEFGFNLETEVFRIFRQTSPGIFNKEAGFLPPPPVPSSFNTFRTIYNEGNRLILQNAAGNILIYEKQGNTWTLVQGNPVPGTNPVLSVDDSRAFFPKISWTDQTDEDFFELYRTVIDAQNNVLFDGLIATLCPNQTEYVDTVEAFGKTVFYVVEAVYDQVSTAASSNGATYSMPARLDRLQLSYSCYEGQGDSLNWSVFNPNAQDHPFIFAQWWSNQRDTLWVPGQSTALFKTKNNPQSSATFGDDNITGIWWIDQSLAAGTPFDLVQNGIVLSNACPTGKRSVQKARQAGSIFAGQLSPYIKTEKPDLEGIIDLAESLVIGPNPLEDILEIRGLPSDGEIKIELYNSLGQLIKDEEVQASNRMKLSLEELDSGVYLINIYASGQSISKKLIKK